MLTEFRRKTWQPQYFVDRNTCQPKAPSPRSQRGGPACFTPCLSVANDLTSRFHSYSARIMTNQSCIGRTLRPSEGLTRLQGPAFGGRFNQPDGSRRKCLRGVRLFDTRDRPQLASCSAVLKLSGLDGVLRLPWFRGQGRSGHPRTYDHNIRLPVGMPERAGRVGWDRAIRESRSHLIVELNRFLLRPGQHYRNLASKVLSMCTRRLSDDFVRLYRIRPVLAETFVSPGQYGVSLRAAGVARS